MVGVGTFVLRNKEIMGIIKPYKELLIINKIRFPEELREYDELKVPKSKTKPGELKLAISLIEQNSEPFNTEQFKDQYNANLLKIIKKKAKGKPLKVSKSEDVDIKTVDLMEKLKASLQKSKKNVSAPHLKNIKTSVISARPQNLSRIKSLRSKEKALKMIL